MTATATTSPRRRAPVHENVYLPRRAVIEHVSDEIPQVKTFRWRFEDPADQAAFRRFRPGQFAQVSVFGAGEFPLSLPASPSEPDYLFTARAVGTCSAALHQLRPGEIRNEWLRDFTQAAMEAPVPVILGGHSLVCGGLYLLTEAAWKDYPPPTTDARQP